jgi:acetyl esterase/lipase
MCRRFFLPSLLVLILALAGCRPVEVLDALTPNTGYRLESGIAYGALPRQRLDIYQPTVPRAVPGSTGAATDATATAAPVIVFFYGGSWNSGARADYRFVGQLLAAVGFTVVIPDYRLYPEVRFPSFLEDGAAALRWTQQNIAAHGGDPHRLFLMGHSAGAYNAMMLALDRRLGAAAGFDAARLCGVVGLAGPYDFKFDTDLLRGIFGTVPNPADALPVTYAKDPAPPVLLIMGDADKTVDPANSFSLERQLRAAGNPVRLHEVPGLDHIDVVLQLSGFLHPHSAIRDEILAFLDRPAAFTGAAEPRAGCGP